MSDGLKLVSSVDEAVKLVHDVKGMCSGGGGGGIPSAQVHLKQ